jgi:hypothetical protein
MYGLCLLIGISCLAHSSALKMEVYNSEKPVDAHQSRCLRFEVFTAVTMKNGVFWVVTQCGSCKNRRFGGTWQLLHQGDKNR